MNDRWQHEGGVSSWWNSFEKRRKMVRQQLQHQQLRLDEWLQLLRDRLQHEAEQPSEPVEPCRLLDQVLALLNAVVIAIVIVDSEMRFVLNVEKQLASAVLRGCPPPAVLEEEYRQHLLHYLRDGASYVAALLRRLRDEFERPRSPEGSGAAEVAEGAAGAASTAASRRAASAFVQTDAREEYPAATRALVSDFEAASSLCRLRATLDRHLHAHYLHLLRAPRLSSRPLLLAADMRSVLAELNRLTHLLRSAEGQLREMALLWATLQATSFAAAARVRSTPSTLEAPALNLSVHPRNQDSTRSSLQPGSPCVFLHEDLQIPVPPQYTPQIGPSSSDSISIQPMLDFLQRVFGWNSQMH